MNGFVMENVLDRSGFYRHFDFGRGAQRNLRHIPLALECSPAAAGRFIQRRSAKLVGEFLFVGAQAIDVEVRKLFSRMQAQLVDQHPIDIFSAELWIAARRQRLDYNLVVNRADIDQRAVQSTAAEIENQQPLIVDSSVLSYAFVK